MRKRWTKSLSIAQTTGRTLSSTDERLMSSRSYLSYHPVLQLSFMIQLGNAMAGQNVCHCTCSWIVHRNRQPFGAGLPIHLKLITPKILPHNLSSSNTSLLAILASRSKGGNSIKLPPYSQRIACLPPLNIQKTVAERYHALAFHSIFRKTL